MQHCCCWNCDDAQIIEEFVVIAEQTDGTWTDGSMDSILYLVGFMCTNETP